MRQVEYEDHRLLLWHFHQYAQLGYVRDELLQRLVTLFDRLVMMHLNIDDGPEPPVQPMYVCFADMNLSQKLTGLPPLSAAAAVLSLVRKSVAFLHQVIQADFTSPVNARNEHSQRFPHIPLAGTKIPDDKGIRVVLLDHVPECPSYLLRRQVGQLAIQVLGQSILIVDADRGIIILLVARAGLALRAVYRAHAARPTGRSPDQAEFPYLPCSVPYPY